MLDKNASRPDSHVVGPPQRTYKTYLAKEEIAYLRKPNNARAFSMFAFNWLVILGCFLVIELTHSLIITLLALLVMAGRQLGLGILLHECSHRSFFSTPQLNQHIGHWFGGMPLLVPMDFYRPYHMTHHSKTGTESDPDVHNIKQYPVTKSSMLRKILRDFVGLSGFKVLFGVLVYVLPDREGNTVSMGSANVDTNKQIASDRAVAIKNFLHVSMFHSLFFLGFWALGVPALYLFWWICFVFVYPFILRIRQIAEHGAMTRLSSKDVRDTTRTTLTAWWERLLFAPNFVNYHCEHHYLPTVPSYHLKAMHQLLRQRGFYDHKPDALATGGYLQVIRTALS